MDLLIQQTESTGKLIQQTSKRPQETTQLQKVKQKQCFALIVSLIPANG